MKKSIFLMALGFAMVTNVQAQNKLSIGVKLGANLSNVYDTKGENFVADAKFGFVGGGYLSVPLGTLFAIQPEVLYSQKGFKGTGTLLGSPYSYTRTTDYLDVPIFLAIKPSKFLSIMAGPQFSYLMREKNEFKSSSVSSTQEQEFNNDDVRKNTLAFVGGVDVNLLNFVIGARAGWDLKNNNGDGTSDTPRYKNTWYQLTVGFKFL